MVFIRRPFRSHGPAQGISTHPAHCGASPRPIPPTPTPGLLAWRAHPSSPCPPRRTLLGALPADSIPLWVSPPPHGVPASS